MRARRASATPTKIIARLVNKHNDMALSADMSALLAFGEPFAYRLKEAMESFSRTRAYPPIGYAHQIQRWGLCIRDSQIDIEEYDLSDPIDLDELHLIYLEWFFTNNPAAKKSNLETLRRYWTNQGDFIKYCQQSKALPPWEWFVFPKMRTPSPNDYKDESPAKRS